MKTKSSKRPKQAKPAVRLKDMKPKKNAKGGRADVPDVIVGGGEGTRGHVR